MGQAVQSGAVQVEGSPGRVAALFGMLNGPESVFPLVEPRMGAR